MNKRNKKKNTINCIRKYSKADPIISSPNTCLFINTILSERWKIIDKIGQGSFGLIYVVEDILTKNKPKYAIKVENLHSLNLTYSLVQKEAKILTKMESEDGFPRNIKYFQEYSNNCLVMTLLGDNLNLLMKKCGSFSVKTIIMLGYHILIRLESLHLKGLLHRDIKPENIVTGHNSDYNKIFLIDFGLSKPYLDENGIHIPLLEKKGLIGTARYASINAHNGMELSRRDDLESWIYVLVYLANGKLPWQNIAGESKDLKYSNILKIKESIIEETLCEGLPLELTICLKYIKSLQFEETPNYKFLKRLLTDMLEGKTLPSEIRWDWMDLLEKTKENSTIRIYSEKVLLLDAEKAYNFDKEKLLSSLTNIGENGDKENENLRIPMFSFVSLGTSKMAHFTRCDLEENDFEEREINPFFKKENMKPKFLGKLEEEDISQDKENIIY